MLNKRIYHINIVILLTILFYFLTTKVVAGLPDDLIFDGETLPDSIFSSDIHTVILRNSSWEFSLPVIELNSNEKLELLFDQLKPQYTHFNYTLIHCDETWRSSSLSQQQYLQGFTEGELTEMHSSFNTTYDYVNYRLVFPEEQMEPVISGNYVIVVYETGHPENILLIKRFYVLERRVEIDGRMNRPSAGMQSLTGQLVQFTVIDRNHEVRDPDLELYAVVKQNERFDNQIVVDRPQFIHADRYDYTYPDRPLFPGGNEFRSFDIKNLKYLTEYIASIDFRNPYYHVFLKQDEARESDPYFSETDLDGDFYVERENAVNKNWEADYVYVHFKLEWPYLFVQEPVYVMGQLTGWTAGKENKMNYNLDEECYELTLLLKQGWYNYVYASYSPVSGLNENQFEGNHAETENRYTVYLYDKDPAKGFTRLIGLATVMAP